MSLASGPFPSRVFLESLGISSRRPHSASPAKGRPSRRGVSAALHAHAHSTHRVVPWAGRWHRLPWPPTWALAWQENAGSVPRGPCREGRGITTARPTLPLAWCLCAAGFQLCLSAWVLAAWGCWALASLSPSRVASWVLRAPELSDPNPDVGQVELRSGRAATPRSGFPSLGGPASGLVMTKRRHGGGRSARGSFQTSGQRCLSHPRGRQGQRLRAWEAGLSRLAHRDLHRWRPSVLDGRPLEPTRAWLLPSFVQRLSCHMRDGRGPQKG